MGITEPMGIVMGITEPMGIVMGITEPMGIVMGITEPMAICTSWRRYNYSTLVLERSHRTQLNWRMF